MPLVLKEKVNRKGETTSFDVVRAQEGNTDACLKNIPSGQYKIMDGSNIDTFDVSYRVVQDIKPAG